ncbi:MAG TPA: methyl-accepting chemotaxis protein, partial [Telluria sp.]|nr:methyl-accepting chemotaxis protein [Telluria sp.]
MRREQMFRLAKRGLPALAASAAAAGLLQWLAGAALAPVVLAVAAALPGLLLVLLLPEEDAGRGDAFARRVGGEIDHLMIGAAQTSYFVDAIKKKVDVDLRTTETIAEQAERTTGSTEQIATNAARAARVATEVRTESVAGRAEIDQGLRQIGTARSDAQAASEVMLQLQEKSRRIHVITEVINEIAARTNLLALNAAIEAARAGEQGRGFAVVAGEVRQLAARTKEATDEIGQMVRAINEEAERATTGMAALSGRVAEAAGYVERVHTLLAGIEKSAGESETEIQQIATSAQGHVSAAREIAQLIHKIRDGMLATESELPLASSSAMVLLEHAEKLFDAATEANAPTSHDAMREVAEAAAR